MSFTSNSSKKKIFKNCLQINFCSKKSCSTFSHLTFVGCIVFLMSEKKIWMNSEDRFDFFRALVLQTDGRAGTENGFKFLKANVQFLLDSSHTKKAASAYEIVYLIVLIKCGFNFKFSFLIESYTISNYCINVFN